MLRTPEKLKQANPAQMEVLHISCLLPQFQL